MVRLGLDTLADRRTGFLSGGQRRRLDLATALVHEPRLLVLDEPTTGLDPQTRRALWAEIAGLAEAGTTVLLTTQYMEEADRLCDRVGIIDSGQLIAEGSPAGLRAATGDEVITVDLTGSVDGERLRRRFGRLRDLRGVVVGSTTVSVASADPAETVPVYCTSCAGPMSASPGFGSAHRASRTCTCATRGRRSRPMVSPARRHPRSAS